MDENDVQTLSTISAMYYLDGISQDEIAKRFFTSRSSISRMLKKARNNGIVDIKINFSAQRNRYYEDKLKELFGVDAVIVNSESAETAAEDNTGVKVRKELAAWMHQNIKTGDVIGVTRGSIFYDIPDYLAEAQVRNVSFAQLMGMEAPSAGRHYARDVVTRLSKFYSGRPYYLDAPLIFAGQEARAALFQVPTIAATLAAVDRAALLLTTIPRLEKDQEVHIWQGFISKQQYDEIIQAGAVGAMFGQAFDAWGNFLDTGLNPSIVSADMAVIKTRKILAVSYGKEFAAATLGALRSGYINHLICDSDCALEIIRVTDT